MIVSIASGLPRPTSADGTPGVIAGIFAALGTGALVVTLGVARSRRVIVTGAFALFAVALGVLVASPVAMAVPAAIVFSPSATLTTARVGFAVPSVAAVGFLVLVTAAWCRLV